MPFIFHNRNCIWKCSWQKSLWRCFEILLNCKEVSSVVSDRHDTQGTLWIAVQWENVPLFTHFPTCSQPALQNVYLYANCWRLLRLSIFSCSHFSASCSRKFPCHDKKKLVKTGTIINMLQKIKKNAVIECSRDSWTNFFVCKKERKERNVHYQWFESEIL